jgi:hypothetical protein
MSDSQTLDCIDKLIALAERVTRTNKPQWEARKDVTKTLISLSSAILVFTITFSTSLLKPETLRLWRYIVLLCWVLFAFSLAASLASLWISIGLTDLPALIMARTRKIEDTITNMRSQMPQLNTQPMLDLWDQEFMLIVRREKMSRRLFNASVLTFGIGLLIFTVVGTRQLIH